MAIVAKIFGENHSSLYSSDLCEVFLKNTSDIVICLSRTFDILLLNNSAEYFYHIDAGDIQEKNFFDLCEKKGYTPPIDKTIFNQKLPLECIQDIKNSNSVCTVRWLISFANIKKIQNNVLVLMGRDKSIKKNNMARYLERIISCLPGSLYWKDLNGRYLGCNEFMVQTAGLNSMSDIVGKTDFELWPQNAKAIVENDKAVIVQDKTVCREEAVKISNGTQMYFASVKMPLKDENDQIIGVIGNSLDITPLKKVQEELSQAKEKAEQTNLVKTDFIRNMEHDIRTPFTGVYGLADFLYRKEEDTLKKELLGDISKSAKELLNYCNAILDYAQVEMKAMPILAQKFNLKKLVNNIIDMENPAAKYKGLLLILKYNEDLPEVVIGDPHRLYRVLLNLVSNAIKFTSGGYICLRVSCVKQVTEQRVILRFIIEDTGIGIPQDKKDFIYEKFIRLSPSNKGLYKGLGLGLPIVKQFMEEMEGEIDVKSVPQQGSTFYCTIPFKIPLTEDLF